jgi:hypothetical protein
MRLFSLPRVLGVLLVLGAVFRSTLIDALGPTDHEHLEQRVSDVTAAVVGSVQNEERAFKLARDGMNCLAGSSPCPNGQRSPLK